MFEQYQIILLSALSGLFVILTGWLVILQISIAKIKKSQKKLFQGKEAKSLEEIIIGYKENIDTNTKDIEKIYHLIAKNYFLASKSVHRTGLIRFNPFRDIGGDQSFSLALLDKDNDGVVISSLYSREGVRVYAKAISRGISEKYPLTEEEKHAIAIASIDKKNQINKKAI